MAHFTVPHAIYWHSSTFEVVWHHATIYTYTHCTWPKRHAHKLQIGVINDCLLSRPFQVANFISIMLPGYFIPPSAHTLFMCMASSGYAPRNHYIKSWFLLGTHVHWSAILMQDIVWCLLSQYSAEHLYCNQHFWWWTRFPADKLNGKGSKTQ